MSNRWVAIDPDILIHPLVGAGQPVPPADPLRGAYSRMEAWVWLICNASFADHTIFNRGRKMTLQRGDLLGGWRCLAQTWNWSVKTVRVWVEDLIADKMLNRRAVELQGELNVENHGNQQGNYYGNQAQILSVVNYWRFQFEGYELGQPTGQPRGNQRATHNKGTREQGKKEDSMAATAAEHEDAADVGGGVLDCLNGARFHHQSSSSYRYPSERLDRQPSSPPQPQPSRSTANGHAGATVSNGSATADSIAPEPTARQQAREAFALFVDAAKQCGLPAPRDIDAHLVKLTASISKHGLDGWREVLTKIRASAFLKGENPNGWRLTLSWLVKPENFAKVLDGNYDKRNSSKPLSRY
jgi:hypothetical protein